jgi:hypothetical protein
LEPHQILTSTGKIFDCRFCVESSVTHLEQFISIVAGIVVVLSAWRQRKANLHNRRLSVYEAVMSFMRHCARGDQWRVSGTARRDFCLGTADAESLFPEQISALLNGLLDKADLLRSIQTAIKRESVDEKRLQLCKQECDLSTWFEDQMAIVRKEFKPFVVIPNPK